jgi:hypothetical protein
MPKECQLKLSARQVRWSSRESDRSLNPCLIAKVLSKRTNELKILLFSPMQEDFRFEAGVSTPAGL